MLDIIKQTLALLKAIATATPNTIDDKIIEVVDKVIGNDLVLQIILDLIDQWFHDPELVRSATVADLTPEQIEILDREKIDWANLLSLIKKIIEMLGLFMEPKTQ